MKKPSVDDIKQVLLVVAKGYGSDSPSLDTYRGNAIRATYAFFFATPVQLEDIVDAWDQLTA